MVQQRLTERDELILPSIDDLQHIVDVSDTTDHAEGSSKKITLQNLYNSIIDRTIRKNLLSNYLKNGNFINNSTNGYGGTPDDWTSSSGNPVQGGIPTLTKAQLISILGVSDGDIEGLWPLNEASGNALDLSSSGYNLTDTNTVGASDDGLMALARDFEADNSEYFTIADASCANLEISGSQTWFAFIKPESVGDNMHVMAKRNTKDHSIIVTDTKKFRFRLQDTTISSGLLDSDVILETGKWYFICGVYDSSNSLMKVWVNGVKKEATNTGTAGDSDADFRIGTSQGAGLPFDGLIQNAGILSVALTDDQVKRLWAYTSYKGQKIRRATTDALLYQDLPQDLVERLRGRTVTLRAKVYVGSTNHRIYIYDGTDTTAASPTGANAWEEISATATIGATATQIRIGLEADTTDGNMWIKEVALYEGSTLLPYDHSKEDWERFPKLLTWDLRDTSSGYKFDKHNDDGWISTNETWTYDSATTITVPTGAASKYAKGDKIKLTQTTVKYFSVVSVADTVLTVTGGTGYTVADAAISLNYYSHQESPIGFPHWFTAATPTYGGGGDMTFTSVSETYNKFKVSGKTVTYKLRAAGTTGGVASTTITFSLPVTAAGSHGKGTGCGTYDSGWKSGYVTGVNSTVAQVFKGDGSNWALAASKNIDVQVIYEI